MPRLSLSRGARRRWALFCSSPPFRRARVRDAHQKERNPSSSLRCGRSMRDRCVHDPNQQRASRPAIYALAVEWGKRGAVLSCVARVCMGLGRTSVCQLFLTPPRLAVLLCLFAGSATGLILCLLLAPLPVFVWVCQPTSWQSREGAYARATCSRRTMACRRRLGPPPPSAPTRTR